MNEFLHSELSRRQFQNQEVLSKRTACLFSGMAFLIMVGTCFSAEAGRENAEKKTDKYQELVNHHPFLPKASPSASPVKSATAGSYRFTGFVILGENVRVGLENVPQNKSYLLATGQTQDEITLKDVNVKEKFITLVVSGETLRLDLTESSPSAPAVMPQGQAQVAASPSVPVLTGGHDAPAPPRRRVIVPTRK